MSGRENGAGVRATLEQERAAYAWERAREGVSIDAKAYVPLVKSAPALIMNNGLMQALAYYESKGNGDGKDPHELVSRHVLQWLHKSGLVPAVDFDEAMGALHRSDSRTYRRATEEALAMLKWLRQLAGAAGSSA